MTRNLPVNVIVIIAVGIVVALIGLVTFFSTRLVNDTVMDQFESQELQLASSLSQQTETYFNGLIAEISNLSAQSAINTAASDRLRDDALALLAEHGAARPGIIRSITVFTYRGEPRYAWPESLAEVIDTGARYPYALDSRLVQQTMSGNYVPIDTQLVRASHRYYPDKGTFLLITPVYTDLRKTDLLVYDLDLDALFNQLMSFVELDARGQLWVLNRDEVLFQANDAIPIESLLDKISLVALVSFREPTLEKYTVGNDERLAVIAPITTQGRDFAVILSRDIDVALNQVESDLRQIFVLAAGAILLIALLTGVVWRGMARAAQRHLAEMQRRQTARTLLEVSRALNSTLNLADVLRSILAELSNILPYDSAAVLLLDRSRLVVAAHRGPDVGEHQVAEFDLEKAQAAKQVLQTGRPLVIQDTLQDERWHISPTSQIRAWMGIPLRVRDQTVGVLNINSFEAGHFTPEQTELAEAFADQASVALQNARLHEVEVKQIEQELTIAREIQTSLLPSAAPDLSELEIVAYTAPARQVSGDYFQYLPMPNGHLGIAVGDVSGKGIPAAIMMAVITTAMRDEVARNARPADLLNALNKRLLERMKATHVNSALMVGIFDPATRKMEIANGGMVQPYVRLSGAGETWNFVPVGGYPLGLSQRLAYTAKEIELPPGSLTLFMSDGVVEAQNTAGEMYGFERVEALLNSLPADSTAQMVVDRVLAGVRDHLGPEEAQDDLTMLVIRSLDGTSPPTSAAPDSSEAWVDVIENATTEEHAIPDSVTSSGEVEETESPDSTGE